MVTRMIAIILVTILVTIGTGSVGVAFVTVLVTVSAVAVLVLVTVLAEQLRVGSTDPFAPLEVVVGSRGMERHLRQALAERRAAEEDALERREQLRIGASPRAFSRATNRSA